MAQRGKRSAASLAVVGNAAPGTQRLPPPRELTDAQRATWLSIVNSKPAEWFGPEHVPMLEQFVRHTVTADVLTQQIEKFEPEWMADPEGLKRYDRLLAMHARETGCINVLARSMRLTQQSIYRADKAATLVDRVGRSRKPWEQPENE